MNYDSFATTFSNSRKNLHWPELSAIIESMKKNGVKSVLDIGCGNGRFLEEARDGKLEMENYLGIDNSEQMIEEARRLHP
jgi:predicted TPR repeat methyltransferase